MSTTKRTLAKIKQNIVNNRYIHFSEDDFKSLQNKEIDEIVSTFSGRYLFRLPEAEIKFNEWLKVNDIDVWNDLWNDDKNLQQNSLDIDSKLESHFDELYYVSISLLPVVVEPSGRGLPICDLQTVDNYYFCMDNMFGEESKIIIEVAEKLFHENKPLTVAQLLALEISIAPIDIWHFAYKHKINLEEAKLAVSQLVDDDVLVHLKLAEYLLPFIKF